MNIVLFLGAGYSKDVELPVMNDFFPYAQDRLPGEDFDFLESLRLHAHRGSRLMQLNETNLEDVLTFALMTTKMERTAADESQKLDERLLKIIGKVYGRVPRVQWSQRTAGLMEQFLDLNKAKWNHQLTVITTNYDLVAETTLALLELPPALPFEYTQLCSDETAKRGRLYAQPSQKTKTTICKLHGSVNWYRREDESLKVEDALIERPSANGGESLVEPVEPHRHWTPLIVPPTYAKLQTEPCLEAAASAGWKALHEAERVIFVGYSFPRSDTYMMHYLATAFTENLRLRRIMIIDPAAKDIMARLSKDHGFKDELMDKILAHPTSWPDPNLKACYDYLPSGSGARPSIR